MSALEYKPCLLPIPNLLIRLTQVEGAPCWEAESSLSGEVGINSQG